MVSPDRQLCIAKALISGGSAKEKYFLSGRANAIADGFGKQFAEPRPTGENVLIRSQLRTIRKRQTIPLTTVEITHRDSQLLVFAAFRQKSIQYCLACNACS